MADIPYNRTKTLFLMGILCLAMALMLSLLLHRFTQTPPQTTDKGSPAAHTAHTFQTQTSTPTSSADKRHWHARQTAVFSHQQPQTPHIALSVSNENEYRSLLAVLKKHGCLPRQTLPRIRTLVIDNDYHLMALLRRDFPNLIWEDDATIRQPNPPTLTANTPGIPFRQQLLPWLGINTKTPNRGKDITIAILDQPIAPSERLSGAAINSLDPFHIQPPSQGSHGNAVASLIVAQSDTLQGIAPQAAILSIPVLDDQGTGSVFTLAEAIIQATDHGADIISLSLGTEAPSPVLQAAVDYAVQNGAVIVAAAGNDPTGLPVYPAACKQVIGVAACDAAKNTTSFSNYGDHVDIAAPGLALDADFGNNEPLELFSGTSAATPCVAAVIANVLSDNPNLTPQEAADRVLQAAEDNGAPNRDPQYGNGIINYPITKQLDKPDFTDAIAAGQFLDLKNATQTITPLIISAQNTGNTTIETLTVNMTVNDEPHTQEFHNVPPGATVSHTLDIDNSKRNSLDVLTIVSTDAKEDSLRNNIKQTHITVTLKEPTP